MGKEGNSRKITVAALVFLCVLLTMRAAPVSAQEVLTNDSIVQMARAGLPEGIIVAKIRAGQTKFDLRTEALIALKQAGVADKILEAMVEQSAQAAAPPPPSVPAPAQLPPAVSPPFQIPAGVIMPPSALEAFRGRRGTVYHVLGDNQVELTPMGAEIQTHTVPVIGYKTSELLLPGNKAGYRTAERRPVFLSTQSPSEIPLVRLKPGSDDRNLKFSSSSRLPFVGTSQRQGVRAGDRIDVEADRDARGFYRIRPRKPLEAGEYGFVLLEGFAIHGFVGGASGKVYDFGVD